MIRRFLALLAAISIGFVAAPHAEGGCPPGQYPHSGQGWQTCVPVPGSAPADGKQPVPSVPSKWVDNWQAIATDSKKGALGTSVDKSTARIAESEAMDDCKAKGGDACAVQVSFRNGCISMVVGDHWMAAEGAANEHEASQSALSRCSASDTNCHVYYSACSLPIEVPK